MSDYALKLRILIDSLIECFQDWRDNVWREDLDSRYCCDGRDCLCGGMTLRDLHIEFTGKSND